jgi:hypothetical protein
MNEARWTWTSVVRAVALAAVVGASLLAAAMARAAEPVSANVHIRVIHAKTGTKHFDAHLEDLRKHLEPYKYNSFHELADESLPLDVAATKGIGLLSGSTLNATLVAVTPDKATIRLVLVGRTGQMLDTTISAGPGKLFFIAGPRYDEGVLFIAIEPNYDPANLPAPNVSDSSTSPKHE